MASIRSTLDHLNIDGWIAECSKQVVVTWPGDTQDGGEPVMHFQCTQ